MSDGIPIYIQLRDQLRSLILRGELPPAYKLPSVRQLASYLSINRHTVSRALDELEEEHLIVREHGRGTFVAGPNPAMVRRSNYLLRELGKRAIQEARNLGFSAEEVANVILSLPLQQEAEEHEDLAIGFVECNWISANRYAIDLRRELGLRVDPLLIADLQSQVDAGQHPDAKYDLVVTTVGHFPEVRRILGAEARLYSITGGPYLKVFFEVLALPAHQRVGIITASEVGSIGMKQAMVQAGIPENRIILASLESSEKIVALIRDADALVVSSTVMADVSPFLPDPPLPLFEYHNVLDATGVEALRQILHDLGVEKAAILHKHTASPNEVTPLDLQRALDAMQ